MALDEERINMASRGLRTASCRLWPEAYRAPRHVTSDCAYLKFWLTHQFQTQVKTCIPCMNSRIPLHNILYLRSDQAPSPSSLPRSLLSPPEQATLRSLLAKYSFPLSHLLSLSNTFMLLTETTRTPQATRSRFSLLIH